MNDLERPSAAEFGEARPLVPQTSGAMQAQARELAEMQTKFLMAQQFPRDERRAIDGIKNAFSRTGLAERAQYEYAKGGSSISGLSIHAMQAIAQQWGNIEFGWSEVSRGVAADGVPFSEVRALACDLQSRTMRPLQFIVRHWRDTRSGGYKLKDEREIYELCANMAQRRVRSCLEAVIPRDVQDLAEEQASVTLRTKADTSPEAMHKMVEAFLPFGVTKEQIELKIQRRLDSISPAQVVMLKRIYASLRDEMSTAAEWFDVEPEAPAAAGLGAVRAAAATAAEKKKAKVDKSPDEPAPPPASAAAPAPAPKPPRRSYAAFVAILNAHGPDGDAKAAAADMEAARAELPPEHWDELCNYHERVFGSRPQGAK